MMELRPTSTRSSGSSTKRQPTRRSRRPRCQLACRPYDDRVEIHGVQGSPPPPTTTVAITAIGGWENSVLLAMTGTDLDAKVALVERSVRRYTSTLRLDAQAKALGEWLRSRTVKVPRAVVEATTGRSV